MRQDLEACRKVIAQILSRRCSSIEKTRRRAPTRPNDTSLPAEVKNRESKKFGLQPTGLTAVQHCTKMQRVVSEWLFADKRLEGCASRIFIDAHIAELPL